MIKLLCLSMVLLIIATDIRYFNRRINNFSVIYTMIWLVGGVVLSCYDDIVIMMYLLATCLLSVFHSGYGIYWFFDNESSVSVWLKKMTMAARLDKLINRVCAAILPDFIKRWGVDKKIERAFPGQWE